MMHELDSRLRGNDNEGTTCRAPTGRTPSAPTNGRWGEWLAVAGCVGFGLAILFPAAGLARGGGKAQVCLANLHLLGRAWTAYQEDYDGRLVGLSNYPTGLPPAAESSATGGTPYRWVEYPLYTPVYGSAAVSQAECNLNYQLNGIRAGKLFAYTENEQVYHCPSDTYWTTRSFAPWISYSGSGCMNSEDFTSRSGMTFTSFRTVTLPSGQSKQVVCVNKFNQIKTPAIRFTFVEEDYVIHNQWRMAGSFITMAGSNYWSWWDWPALYHSGRSSLGFADGHTENHVWQDQRTLDLIRTGSVDRMVQPNNPDLVYVNNGYVPAGW
jgi:prepilin-type processing-associated H-X9-DG protein